MANEFIVRKGLFVQGGQTQITGTLIAAQISGSLYGTSSYAYSASYVPNLYPQLPTTQSIYATQSLFATQSLYATQSLTSSLSNTASYVAGANVDGAVANATNATNATYGTYASYLNVTGENNQVRPLAFYSGLGQTTFYGDSNNGITYNESNQTLTVPQLNGTASWATKSISSSYAPQVLQTTVASASWASASISASYAPSTPSSTAISSSWASQSLSASYISPYGPYTTLTTSSLKWITCSFSNPNYVLNLPVTAAYNFTASNVSSTGQESDILVYISHSAASGTSSFKFPSNWVNIGTGWPSIINANTVATLWLRSIDTNIVIGTYNTSGSFTSASYALSASYAPGSSTGTQISCSWASSSMTASSVVVISVNDSNLYNIVLAANTTSPELLSIGAGSTTLFGFNPSNGNLNVGGSIMASSVSASLFGTSSWANKAISASYAPQTPQISGSWASSSINAISSSYPWSGSGDSNITYTNGVYNVWTKKITGFSTTAGDYENVFTYNPFHNYDGAFIIQMSIGASSISQAKTYLVNYQYDGTSNTWYSLNPITSTGPYNGNDVALDINIATQFMTVRVRRISGTNAADINISVQYTKVESNNLVTDSTIGSGATVVGIYSGTPLTQVGGNVGIGTMSPNNTLEVVGNIYCTSITGSLLGTASWANNALTTSYITSSNIKGNVTAFSSSWASSSISSSYSLISTTSSYSLTSSYAINAGLVQQVSCFPDGTYVYNGITYKPIGSTTCGIQEAINSLPTASNYQTPGGGTIYFAPGIFYTSASIVSPNTRYPFGLQLYGAGITSTCIVMSGSNASGSVIEFGFGNFGALTGSCNDKSFHMKDMCVASAFNTTNSIVYIHGPGANVSSASIATAVVEHCWMGWWQAIITQDSNITHEGGVLTPSANDDYTYFGPIKHNLVGVRLDSNFTNNCIFRDNEFTFLAVGLAVAGDHIVIQDNVFSFCGRMHGVDNDWPFTSPYRIGAGIVLQESTNVGGLVNGNDNWRCSGNNFIGSNASSSCYIFNSLFKYNRMVYGDSFEVDNGCGYIVTNGSPITVINPMYPAKYFSLVNYLLPSTSDFTNWNSQPISSTFSSSLIKTWDMNWDNTYDGPFSFSGSVTALHLTASILGTSSFSISASYAPGTSTGTQVSCSWASQSLSASYCPTFPTTVLSASWVSASNFITTAQTASFVTASNVVGVVNSASYSIELHNANVAITNDGTIGTTGTVTAATGNFNTITGKLNGTASWANTASVAISASSAPSTPSSTAVSCSWASSSISSSYALSASSAPGSGVTSGGSYNISASWASASISSSYALSASWAPSSGIGGSTSGSIIVSDSTSSILLIPSGGLVSFTRSLGNIPTSGMYQIKVAATFLYKNYDDGGGPKIKFFFRHSDQYGLLTSGTDLGYYLYPPSGDETIPFVSEGDYTLEPPASAGYCSFVNSNYIFQATAGTKIEYYYLSPVGYAGHGTASFTSSAVLEQLVPIVAGGGGGITSGGSYNISASWASSSLSSSYVSSYQNYSILTTSSLNWITCSFSNPNYVLNLTNTASYYFTASAVSTAGLVSDALIYISHSALTGTSSFTFPVTWQNIGSGWPSTINAGSIATLWLRSIDTNTIIGTYNISGSTSSTSSYALTSSYAPTASYSSTSSYALTSSYAPTASYILPSAAGNGAFAYANWFGNAACTNNQTYNAKVTFIRVGFYGVKFGTAASNNFYSVAFTGITGSTTAPTASVGCVVNPTTTAFTMSVNTGTSFIIQANCISGSIIVFGY